MPSSPMGDLPVDVITDILSRLPVASLLQFRSISKSWRSLIDSHHFKTLHLNKFHNLNSNLILLRNKSDFYTVDLPTLGKAINLNQPLKSYGLDITILGSCNGLLCITNFFDEIAIWNPSLRKHWVLPSLPKSRRLAPNMSLCTYGFGFDSFTEDYKLVKISYFNGAGSTFGFNVNLFSCKTNAWKTLPKNKPYTHWSSKSVFVDHALHWVVVQNFNAQLIVAFDFRLEVFKEVSLPELGNGSINNLLHLGGCLSMVVRYRFSRVDIWVMKQYGSKDSWFILITSSESPEFTPLKFEKPLSYSSDEMKVLFEQDINQTNWYHFKCKGGLDFNIRLFWYNLKSKQVSNVTIPGMPDFDGNMISVESLVQPFPVRAKKKKKKNFPVRVIGSSKNKTR